MKSDYKEDTAWVYPDYKTYCGAHIPSLILSLLGVNRKVYSPLDALTKPTKLRGGKQIKLVMIVIDGLGFNQWEKYSRDYEFFNTFYKKATVAPITTVFPSSTAPALTMLHSGLTPQEHGLLEWYLYLEEVDEIITTLPFTLLGEKDLDQCLKLGIDPNILFNSETIYERLAKGGVRSFAFVNENYLNGAYSNLIFKRAIRIPYKTLYDLIGKLVRTLNETKERTYFYVYWPEIDSIAHEYGPHTKKYLIELQRLSDILQKELLGKVNLQIAEETILLITADHGQIKIIPDDTIYLDEYQEVQENFAISKNGKPILPWGGYRDVFLKVKEEQVNAVLNFLADTLRNKAKIMKSDEALNAGLFGSGIPKQEFLKRIGNLMILPYRNQTVWYRHFKDEKVTFRGHHGGLTKEEMLVPLAIARLSDLL